MTATEKAIFKETMESRNSAARAALCKKMVERTAGVRNMRQVREKLMRDLWAEVPAEETDPTKTCVVMDLSRFLAVGSLDPADYQVKTQVRLIAEMVKDCKTVDELREAILPLVKYGSIWTGSRYLLLNHKLKCVLHVFLSAGKESVLRAG